MEKKEPRLSKYKYLMMRVRLGKMLIYFTKKKIMVKVKFSAGLFGNMSWI